MLIKLYIVTILEVCSMHLQKCIPLLLITYLIVKSFILIVEKIFFYLKIVLLDISFPYLAEIN